MIKVFLLQRQKILHSVLFFIHSILKLKFFGQIIVHYQYNIFKQRRIVQMKKFILKYGHVISAVALYVTATSASTMCSIFFYDRKLPDSAKKLRKF